MTRETKIGLLVGLAFIIVIGILLSDHMTSTTQPPQAALAETARNVGASVTAPAPVNPPPAPVTQAPPITPANPVLTPVELRPPAAQQQQTSSIPAPVSQIVVGGPAVVPQPQQGPIAIRQAEPAPVTQQETAQPSDPTAALEQWAQNSQTVQTAAQPAAPAKREYVAQAGDNLSKIAAKTLGANTKANRDAIVKANPSLQKNPDLIVEGRKYTIPQSAPPPPAPEAQPAVVAASNAGATEIPETVPVGRPPVPVTELVDALPASSPAPDGGSWYVVKENDNLWKIAAEQLGSGNAWQQIRDLNKDVLKGGDTVQPNMRLRLPAKSVASAR
jgi:nucleoid-associated protein YgaU